MYTYYDTTQMNSTHFSTPPNHIFRGDVGHPLPSSAELMKE